MFKLTRQQRKDLMAYMWTRPYGEVAALIAMLASLEEEKDGKTKKICPRCMGNGYFKVMESPQFRRDVIVQCPMCNSEGEIDEDPSYDYSGVDLNKLQ